MNHTTWAILTGEYPPDRGGVSDYTRVVAEGLARGGDRVHVFAPPATHAGQRPKIAGVTVHRLPDSFGMRGLMQIGETLDRLPKATRLLVQYVPHAFGHKAMNIGLCLWLFAQRRRWKIDVMFHEVFVECGAHVSLGQNIMGAVQRAMLILLLAAADRLFVSTSWWEDRIRPFLRGSFLRGAKPVVVLPVPGAPAITCNLPRASQPSKSQRITSGSRSPPFSSRTVKPSAYATVGGCSDSLDASTVTAFAICSRTASSPFSL